MPGDEFADGAAMPLALHHHVIYGPVRSRRLGRSLGVNLLPPAMKVCNMNCAYCQYGWTRGVLRPEGRGVGWPTPSRVEAAVTARLRRAAAANELLDRLTVAGHGEPTLHPEFEEIADRLQRTRDRLAPGLRLAVLSNSTTATWPEIRRALLRFDDRYMKLDAGDPITYSRLNGPGPSVTAIVDALASLPEIIIQAMFVTDTTGRVDNTTDGVVAEWLAAIERVKPAHVHLYTLDRPPARDTLRPVAERRLREIAEQVRSAGIQADVFTDAAGADRSQRSPRTRPAARATLSPKPSTE
jgi:wyosine [tRNA(Phe)-imidazoG37] synthetase (radical SAM superfamily)